MKEAYVSFEIAILLQEKGFPIPSSKYEDWLYSMYDENGKIHWGMYDSNWYARVTHQMALKWLREEKNIHIDFYYLPIHKKYMWSVIETKDPKGTGSKELYEDAVETAIKYCLENLI